jgi:light-regulated signal transduction histidine kinase (bacteriophytochrome)
MNDEDLLPPGAPVDVSNCDREPIHVPGAIQPHGALIAARAADLAVVQASVNVEAILGIAHAAVLDAPLGSLFAAWAAELDLPRAIAPGEIRAFRAAHRGRLVDVAVHRSGDVLIVEIEPVPPGAGDDAVTLCDEARRAVEQMRSALRLTDLWPEVARIIRGVTGFDRVMVYRFSPDGAGQVIAEAVAEGVEGYLGLWYPASDIPQQARALYLENRIRLIVDAAYEPAPILPVMAFGAPLDLSRAVLRSVSPMHCQYLANMRVRAAMSISLVHEGRLWGLVACHHLAPLHVGSRRRSMCALLGDVASWMLGPKLEAEQAEARVQAAAVRAALVERMATRSDLATALVEGAPTALDLVTARGFAVSHGGAVRTLGAAPPKEALAALLAWVRDRAGDRGVYATDALAAAYPPAAALQDTASGVLAAVVSCAHDLTLIWLRPEVVREVSWAGDPHKPADLAGNTLGPRRSFALWKETVRGRSLAWAPWEIEAAEGLRATTVSLVLQKAAEFFRLNLDLRSAVQSRDEFLAMASHELRTPTTTLSLQLGVLRRLADADRLPRAEALLRLDRAIRQVARIEALIGRLLDVSRISSGRLDLQRAPFDLAELAREVVARQGGAGVAFTAEGDTRGSWDRFRLDQVVTNLVSNAFKFGGGHPVDVTIRGEGDRVVLAVRDRGLGVSEEARERIFQRFERAVSPDHFAGFGLGLWISRRIVEEHGGRIAVESAPGAGSTFTVELTR